MLVRGVVQGVGFRPFVNQLANDLHLGGWVRNTQSGAMIEVEGAPGILQVFRQRLDNDRPQNCVIQSVEVSAIATRQEHVFSIQDSSNNGADLACSIPPDLATCERCLSEVFDPNDRRYRYPFTNCTACGPRYSIITGLPYDRPNTTMQSFTMCEACQNEYEDSNNRRFHAQPNACPVCGPQLLFKTMTGRVLSRRDDALDQACEAIHDGQVVAVKGVGGFHLIVDAGNTDAVAALRHRKRRPTKPFAVMMRSIKQVQARCNVSDIEQEALNTPAAPIVLLTKCGDAPGIADAVAPENPNLGVILAYTPLHHLMLDRLGMPVVATSGNLSDEPICINDRQTMQRLGSVADFILTHDRPIARAVDDSIVQVIDGLPRVMRRSRGFAPLQILLPHHTGGPVLAVGAHQKSTIGVAVGGQAILSQHIGDLETPEACDAHATTTSDLCLLLRAQPARVAADLHPDYRSTHCADKLGPPVQSVQHHAAHLYAAMAEHGLPPTTPVLGAIWDGTGLGEDGTIWGGELLSVNGQAAHRIGHLEPFPLPGGDAAMREPARAAIGLLYATFGDACFEMSKLPPLTSVKTEDLRVLRQMLHAKLNTPATTSIGRLFDAIASLLGLCQVSTFEGEAAIALQYMARGDQSDGVEPLPLSVADGHPRHLDWRPAVRDVLLRQQQGEATSRIAFAFHRMLAEGLSKMILSIPGPPCPCVVLSGGCFQNRLLTELCTASLRSHGITPLLHRDVPPNDGGIALGQLYRATMAESPLPERTL